MDAQNAAGSDKTKPVASPKRPGPEPDEPKASVSKSHAGNARSSPAIKEGKSSANASNAPDDDAGGEGNSDAETIVLPDKEGHSPSKVRKVKHEDKSDGETSISRKHREHRDAASSAGKEKDKDKMRDGGDKDRNAGATGSNEGAPSHKKKRLQEKQPRSKDGSSGLSSAPASPPQHRRRSAGARSDSDSDTARNKSAKGVTGDKSKSVDRPVSHKRKAVKAESEDEAESRKARRQRTSGIGIELSHPTRSQKDHRTSSSKAPNDGPSVGSRNRSASPPHRAHRRSISTQLPSQSSNGLSHKKKRVPAPLQSTDYHSDESSASGSPHPRSSKLRSLATPATADSTISPAKMAPHKKHLDAHGQTFLARACAKGEYEVAKQRLGERPEDLNVADYAGNTPLQIAAINGSEDLVKLLLDAGCNLDCVNYDKDTPLLDAVDNGHLGVVKLLLNAGVNPRKANVNGEEPLDRVNDELDNAAEIRAAIVDAKQRMGELRRTSEDHLPQDFHDAQSSHGPESPRRSPAASSGTQTGAAAAAAAAAAGSRRGGTVRATKTSNHLLYMPMDDKTLRAAAGRGDEETVTRILQVRDGCDDPESMVAAARGGHDLVMQLLLALGGANPDPAPVSSVASEFSTPMLAAIGQENIGVIRLLLDQANFDPTRRFKGEYYHDIARRRQGPNWKDEEHMLKNAYDNHKKSKTKSPNRRERDRDRDHERETKRSARNNDIKEDLRSHKRNLSSPSREVEPRKKLTSTRATTSPKEKRRSNSFTNNPEEQASPKRGPGRPKKEDRIPTINVSDREASPATSQKLPGKAKRMERMESDLAAVSSEGETLKPRRKLVSKGELRGEREKQRRASMASNASSLKDPSSPQDTRHDDHNEKTKPETLTEKYHDRTKALKRDESKDRLSVSGDGTSKRHRSSVTPPHPNSGDKDDSEVPTKRRRLDPEGKERRQKQTASPDERTKLSSSRDPPSRSKSSNKEQADDDRRESSKHKADHDPHRRESGRSTSSDKSSIHVKSEDIDVDMQDAADLKEAEEAEARAKQEREAEKKRLAELEEARKKEEAERKRREAEEKQRKEEEERKRKEEEEKERERIRKEREEEERRRKEEEEARKRKEEEERLRKEEEERKRREAEEEKKRKEEEERKRREEEEERLRKEQLEREAAEEARRKREEEERKERERKERILREEERKRRIFLEQERIRLAKLPPLLRWLDGCTNPKSFEIATKFRHMQGVRYDTIRPQATGSPDGREQWVLNTQVALLLGEKDLDLSRCKFIIKTALNRQITAANIEIDTAWERIPVTTLAKRVIWRLEADRYSLTSDALYDLGMQLTNYYGEDQAPETMGYRVIEKLRGEAWENFLKMDMFFVKVCQSAWSNNFLGSGELTADLHQLSDLMYIVPTIPHLRNLKLAVEYRELPEHESMLFGWKISQKWKQDPDADRFYGFAPRNKYYLNGEMIEEQKPGLTPTSNTPFPEKRVPRRGLLQVYRDDPEYERLCKEQGLEHLINGSRSPSLPNGRHPMPSQNNDAPAEVLNGTNGHTLTGLNSPGVTPARPLPNGINGVSVSASS
jgi:hypothetical protein